MAGEEAIRFLSPEFSQLVALSTVIFAFLYRTTGNRELVIGTPIANRSHALAATCGLVMEQLFLKVEIQDTRPSLRWPARCGRTWPPRSGTDSTA